MSAIFKIFGQIIEVFRAYTALNTKYIILRYTKYYLLKMNQDLESDLPLGVFNDRTRRKSGSMQNLLSIDDELSSRRNVFCNSCRKSNRYHHKNNFCTQSRAVCVIVSVNLIMMIIIMKVFGFS